MTPHSMLTSPHPQSSPSSLSHDHSSMNTFYVGCFLYTVRYSAGFKSPAWRQKMFCPQNFRRVGTCVWSLQSASRFQTNVQRFLGQYLWRTEDWLWIREICDIEGKVRPRTNPEGPEGEQRYTFTLSLTSATPQATLRPGKGSGTLCMRGWVGPRTGVDARGKSRPPPGIRSSDRPARTNRDAEIQYDFKLLS